MYDSVNATSTGHALDWDSVIEHDGEEFTLLPEGTYNFTVSDFQRGRFPGSAKIPACPKAVITLKVTAPDGESTSVRTDLILWGSLEWKIASFFRSIGQKKHGEAFKPDWNAITGATGRVKLKIRTYTNKEGRDVQVNDVDKFLDPEENATPVTAQKPAAQSAAPAPKAPASDDDDLLG